MDWKTFISSIVGHLAWPAVFVFVVFLLRSQIAKLFEKVEHLKYKDLELDFEKVKQRAEAIVEQTPTEEPARLEEEPVFSSLEEQILETVETAPAAAILLAWSAVETSIAAAVARLAVSAESPSYRSPVHNIEMLERSGDISKRHVSLLHEMRILRNKIAHDVKAIPSVSEAQALDYANTAISIVGQLNGIDRIRKVFQSPSGEWSQLPQGFAPSERAGEANEWIYSNIELQDTGLTAGVGPWKSSRAGKGKFAYYGIDIEMPTPSGDRTIDELRIALDLVAPEVLSKNARDIVSFNAQSREVTFDLGKSIFKYRIL